MINDTANNLSCVRKKFNHLNLINSVENVNENAETQATNCDYYDPEEFKKLTQTLHTNNFSILHTNIRSLNANHNKLISMLSTHAHVFDVVSLTETWDQKSKRHGFVAGSIEGYEYYNGLPGIPQKRWMWFLH